MQRHWLVTLQDISASGRQWDVDVPQCELEDESCGEVQALTDLTGDVHWQIDLQRCGDVYRLNGNWRGGIRRQCSRCNAEFDWQPEGETAWEFQLGEAPRHVAAETEVESDCEFLPPPGEIYLLDLLREDVWLAWKADVVCSESCKGLCQGCGVNLNLEPCSCKQDESDHPFAALRGLKLDG